MKNDKIGFCAFPVARTAKVSITDPPQVWVKGSIVVDGNRNFPLGHFEKWQNWVLCVLCRSYSKSVNYRPPISLGQGFHRCWRKSKFPARPLWKMTKLGFVCSPLLVQQKCQLPTPHKFGSRVPSLLTEIKNYPLGHYEKWQNWVLCVPRRSYSKSVNYRPPISLGQGFHRCWRKSKFPARPLWKMTKLGFVRSPLLVQQKCQLLTPHKFGSRVPSLLTEIEISRSAIMKNDKNWVLCVPCRSYSKSVNYRPPISLGQGFHRCWRKSKFPARPLWKMTKLGFVRSPSLVQQKCQLPTPHKFGSRVPLLLTEIEISRSAIMKNDKIGFCAFLVARTAKVSITDPP